MQPRIHFLILSIMILTTTVCKAQVGVVTNNLTLNDRVENFITNSNCDENELNELVRMIQKQGDLLQGLRVMNVAVKRFPDSYYAHYMRGFYNRNLENFEEAIFDFSKAISIEPLYAGAYNDRGECYQALNQVAEANADFNSAIMESEKLLNAGLQYEGIEFAKPFALVGLGRIKEVREWIKNYMGDDYYDVACLYSKMRDRENTLIYIKKALENGYSNIDFIKADNCMKCIADSEEFVNLINQYK